MAGSSTACVATCWGEIGGATTARSTRPAPLRALALDRGRRGAAGCGEQGVWLAVAVGVCALAELDRGERGGRGVSERGVLLLVLETERLEQPPELGARPATASDGCGPPPADEVRAEAARAEVPAGWVRPIPRTSGC